MNKAITMMRGKSPRSGVEMTKKQEQTNKQTKKKQKKEMANCIITER